MNKDQISKLLDKTLEKTDLGGLSLIHSGKVRDVYDLDDKLLIVTTDRISAFDVVLGTVPLKGQVLNTIAGHWFELTKKIVPNHVVALPDPCCMVVKKLKALPVEVVVRRYLTGSLFRAYEKGSRNLYGIQLPKGLQADARFDLPLITPTTKEEGGLHDQPLSPKEVVSKGLVEAPVWEQIQQSALSLFVAGEKEASKRGLILVDTKYEFGMDGEDLLVMDEIHTPDSSRYWEQDEYQQRFRQKQPQKMLDKENIRQWLLQQGYSGEGKPPSLSAEIRIQLAEIYEKLQKRLTGTTPFWSPQNPQTRILENLTASGWIKP